MMSQHHHARHESGRRAARRVAALSMLTLLAAMATLLAGCATTGATLNSGVGDTFFQRAPYYAGQRVQDDAPLAHFEIRFRAADPANLFGPGDAPGTPLAVLLEEMNAYLDSLLPGSTAMPHPRGTPPHVMFGCERQPDDECAAADDRRPYRLAVGRPSRSWVDGARAEAERAGAARTLLINVAVGQYLPQQRNWRGDKEVSLGTGYTVDVPWLTALDRPVNVLQLTGALVDLDGYAVRIGAEGLFARRTNIILSGFGVQALISDGDVERIRTARRDDLPGQPLVWQAALRNMVAELAGRPDSALR
jgi:hypothetical protein